jgi:predicted amidohydrolase YtcJ
MERGLVVAGSSDSPVVPNNPFFGIYAAVNRQTETGHYLLADEAISVNQAIKLYTTNAAYATFEENLKGSLSPGKLADIVMLNDDPMEVPPEKIKDIKVLMTMIDGQVVWQC